ncbi:hypothetical protein BDN67DRAFT_985528 [Paxillus ammoniavirescens]|nr:hypothetical protein BDN67DRAFT_985528 [Paxillus ammoniavirescens]
MAIMQFTFSIDQPAPTGPNVGVMKLDLKPSTEFEETATQQAISSDGYYGQQQPLSVTGTMALWQAMAADSDGHYGQQWPFSATAILSNGHSQQRPFSATGTMAPWPATVTDSDGWSAATISVIPCSMSLLSVCHAFMAY